MSNRRNAERELGGPRAEILIIADRVPFDVTNYWNPAVIRLEVADPGIAELQFGSSTARRM